MAPTEFQYLDAAQPLSAVQQYHKLARWMASGQDTHRVVAPEADRLRMESTCFDSSGEGYTVYDRALQAWPWFRDVVWVDGEPGQTLFFGPTPEAIGEPPTQHVNWIEFRRSGLLWATNRFLRIFGVEIVIVNDSGIDDDRAFAAHVVKVRSQGQEEATRLAEISAWLRREVGNE